MRFDVSHRTTYSYRLPVAQSCHVLHLGPRGARWQTPLKHGLLINPAPATQNEITDYFGNSAILLRIEEEHHELVVHARSTVDVIPPPAWDLAAASPWEAVARLGSQATGAAPPQSNQFDIDVLQFTCRSRHTPVNREIAQFARRYFVPGRPILAGAMDLTVAMYREFRFDPEATDVSTPIMRVLELKRGVCQDFAHLAIAALRSLGLPARYVSGYLLTRPAAGQLKLKGADASHAWLSVWAPETGWVDFDPTNGIIPSGEHITVAWGRDYEDVCPIGGVLLGGGDQRMTVSVDVEPVG
jgi:transglutaminase-like putative cysteine protease